MRHVLGNDQKWELTHPQTNIFVFPNFSSLSGNKAFAHNSLGLNSQLKLAFLRIRTHIKDFIPVKPA